MEVASLPGGPCRLDGPAKASSGEAGEKPEGMGGTMVSLLAGSDSAVLAVEQRDWLTARMGAKKMLLDIGMGENFL